MDVEKTMQFILEKSAANTVQIEMLREMVLADRDMILSHERDLQVHTEWKTEMSQALQDLAAQMKDGFRRMAEKHTELAEAQKTTEGNLNVLIQTVQEMIPRLPKQP